MKKILTLFLAVFLGFSMPSPGQSTEAKTSVSSDPWALFEKQNRDLLQALKTQNMHQIHELSESIGEEAQALMLKPPALPADQQKQFQDGLKAIESNAMAIHKDAHHSAWDDAFAKQLKLTEAIKTAFSLSTEKASAK